MPVRVFSATLVPYPDTGQLHCMGTPGRHTSRHAGRADAWNNAEKIVVTSHYGFVYSQPSQVSQTVSDVAAGNRLKWEGTKGAFL